MSKFLVLSIFLLLAFTQLIGHEGHKEMDKQETMQESVHPTQEQPTTITQFGGRPQTWTQWIGSFHLILLHFPIALINMLAISECLFIWYRRPIFEFSSKFLLISAAIIAPPTALLGLIYSYSASYSGLIGTFLLWHMWLGIGTAIFTVIVAFIRERIGVNKLYYAFLAFLVLMINATGFFGGGMTFGPFHMHPPL